MDEKRIRVALVGGLKLGWPKEDWVIDPPLMDGALQAEHLFAKRVLQLWVLPSGAKTLRLYQYGLHPGAAKAAVFVTQSSKFGVKSDIHVVDALGRSIAVLEDLEAFAVPNAAIEAIAAEPIALENRGLEHMAFEPIAIVGRSCVLPGVFTPEQLWDAVVAQDDLTTEASLAELGLVPQVASWLKKMVPHWCGGWIRGFAEVFDARRFLVPEEEIFVFGSAFPLGVARRL